MGIKKRDDPLRRVVFVGGDSDGVVERMRVGNITAIMRAVSQYSKRQEYWKRITIDGDDVHVTFEYVPKDIPPVS